MISGSSIKAYSYACLMALVPERVSVLVRGYSALVPEDSIYDDESGEFGREGDVHITVKWGFLNNDPTPVQDALADWGPVVAVLRNISAFSSDDYVVLKVDVESPDLHELHNFCKEMFPNKETHPDYVPHVTLVYLKTNSDDSYYYEKYFSGMFNGIELTFNELTFSANDEKTPISLMTSGNEVVARVGRSIRKAMPHLMNVECGRERQPRDMFLEWYGTGKLPDNYERALERFFHTTDKNRMLSLALRSDEVPVMCGRHVFLVDYDTGDFIKKLL